MWNHTPPQAALGAAMPPAAPPVALLLRPLSDGQELQVLALASRAYGLQMHWDGSRHRLHFGPPLACAGCLAAQPMRWYAFLACQSRVSRKRAVLALTAEAVRSCPALDPARGIDLRGRMVTVRRSPSEPGHPQRARVSDDTAPTHVTPPPFNLARALEHILGYPPGTLYLPDDGDHDAAEADRYGDGEQIGGAA